MSFIKFELRGELFITHKTTLLKFPDSLFAKLTSESKEPLAKLEIDRDPKHFEVVLDLMRDHDGAYAAHLSRQELGELVEDLKFYRLSSLEEMVSNMIEPPHPEGAHRPKTIMHDFDNFIRSIKKPTIVIGSITFRDIREFNRTSIEVSAFMSVFDRRYYDVVALSEFEKPELFYMDSDPSSIIKDMTKGYEKKKCRLRVCLYFPGNTEPACLIQKPFEDLDFMGDLYLVALLFDRHRRECRQDIKEDAENLGLTELHHVRIS